VAKSRHQHSRLEGKYWQRTETSGYQNCKIKIDRWLSMDQSLMTEFWRAWRKTLGLGMSWIWIGLIWQTLDYEIIACLLLSIATTVLAFVSTFTQMLNMELLLSLFHTGRSKQW